MRLSIDVGGTFTDLVLIDDKSGSMWVDKVASTPDSGQAVITGIRRIADQAGISPDVIEIVFHGFTIATNAWLTRTGARVAVLVTQGFGDILSVGSQRRPSTYDLTSSKPEPLVPREQVLEVLERTDAFGSVVVPLLDAEVERVVTWVKKMEPEAIAISLLFSWANPDHEQQLAAALSEQFEALPIYCSSDVNPEIQEYPRANTTAAAAYVGPPVRRYTQALEAELTAQGINAPLRYMRSDGGAATADSARGNPSSMLLSGPAGGVVAAIAASEQTGSPNIVTFDMGGTSADFCVVRDGATGLVRDGVVDGLPLRVPMLDIKAISAGGGSIGWVDRGGALRVGPASAGAVPGPAAYGHGGTKPTLTDAAVVLGFLSDGVLAGGDIMLDPKIAKAAIERDIATPLNMDVESAAAGMFAVATTNMAQTIRELSTERGDDIAEFSLLSFGGAGGLFAPFLLRELGLKEVLIPRYPGVFAALGLQYADLRHQTQAPFAAALDKLDHNALQGLVTQLQGNVDTLLARDGVNPEHRECRNSADMRYIGQHHQIEVPLPAADELSTQSGADLARAFHAQHLQRFGYNHLDSPVEMTSVHVAGVGLQSKPAMPEADCTDADLVSSDRTVPVHSGNNQSATRAQVFERDQLLNGHRFNGPAIVTQSDSTLMVLKDQHAYVGRDGFMHVIECRNDATANKP